MDLMLLVVMIAVTLTTFAVGAVATINAVRLNKERHEKEDQSHHNVAALG
jgi:hypothetical protein